MRLRSVGFISALVYTSISLAAAAIFLTVTLRGDYSWVARIGGAGWVFLLAMIVLMPLVTQYVKKRYHEFSG